MRRKHLPVIDHASQNPWEEVLADKRLRSLFQRAYAEFSNDILSSIGWMRKQALKLKCACLPAELKEEIEAVAAITETAPLVVAASQMLYDYTWSLADDATAPSLGCTSISTHTEFGRNLDWGYPDFCKDLVFKARVLSFNNHFEMIHHEVECFAGLLGWVALKSDDPCLYSSSMNQAPKTREHQLSGLPSLWVYRQYSLGESAILNEERMSDFLIHEGVPDEYRKITELRGAQAKSFSTRKGDANWSKPLIQTNRYQLFPLTSPMDEESRERERHAKARLRNRSGKIRSALEAASNDITIDTFMMQAASS